MITLHYTIKDLLQYIKQQKQFLQSHYLHLHQLPGVYREGGMALDIAIEQLPCDWWLPRSWLLCCTYMWIMVVALLSSDSIPPTASSSPCREAHVEKVNGVSASLCHASCLPTIDRVFSRAPRDITSTVLRSLYPPTPPATTRDFPLHTTAVERCLVGMGGELLCPHLPPSVSVKLRSELVTSSFGVFPPIAVGRLLITAILNS